MEDQRRWKNWKCRTENGGTNVMGGKCRTWKCRTKKQGWSCIFRSCIFCSCIFSAPVTTYISSFFLVKKLVRGSIVNKFTTVCTLNSSSAVFAAQPRPNHFPGHTLCDRVWRLTSTETCFNQLSYRRRSYNYDSTSMERAIDAGSTRERLLIKGH